MIIFLKRPPYRMSRLVYLIALLLFSQRALSQAPAWVTEQGDSSGFPAAEYLTGLGIATLHQDSAQERIAAQAYDAAKKDLIEKVIVRVRTSTQSAKQQTNDTYSALYTATVASSSDLEIVGLQKETYTDRRRDLHYAWVYARKQNVVDHYRAQHRQQTEQLRTLLVEAQRCVAANDKAKAEQHLLNCRPLVSARTKAAAVLRSLGQAPPTSGDSLTAQRVEQALESLVQGEVHTLPDLVYVLARQLQQAQPAPLSQVTISPLVYQQSAMASPFARYFRSLLEEELINGAHWSTVPSENLNFAAEPPGAQYHVRGVYEALGDRLAVSLYLEDLTRQEIVGMATATLPQRAVEEAQLSYIPAQYAVRQGEQKLFETDSVLSYGIDLELWTNKGRDALTFVEGETMEIFYRVNIPCYVRFVYHLANGQRVHFFDRQVTAAEVGQPLRVPYDFVCDCTDAPCGVETLQMNARETPLPELATQETDGYAFITENLASIIRKNRGNPEEDSAPTYQAEARLVITTLP